MYETSAEIVAVDSTLRVPLRIAELGTRGRGVLAGRRIAAGELVERAPVILVPEEDRVAVDASSVGSYIFMWEHDSTGEDIYSQKGRVAVVLGFASLVNHSGTPNCRIIRHIEARALDLVAMRDIDNGEEVTFDYGMTLWFTPE
jgi:SET domain-containing protein